MNFLMKSSAALVLLSISGFAFAGEPTAKAGCSIAQVMNTVHETAKFKKYEYASNWAGDQGAPTQKQNENNDQYTFWVEKDGTTYPAIVTYDSGKCTDGVAVVKTNQGE